MCMDKVVLPGFNALDLSFDTKIVHGANSERSLTCGVGRTLILVRRVVYPWHRARERTISRLQRAIDVMDVAVNGRRVLICPLSTLQREASRPIIHLPICSRSGGVSRRLQMEAPHQHTLQTTSALVCRGLLHMPLLPDSNQLHSFNPNDEARDLLERFEAQLASCPSRSI